MTDIQMLNSFCAFFMQGLLEKDYDKTCEKWDQSETELVDLINSYAAPLLGMMNLATSIIGPDRHGVFEYEICIPFGKYFADYIRVTGNAPPRSRAMTDLRGMVLWFFLQNQRGAVEIKLREAFAEPTVKEAINKLKDWWLENSTFYDGYTGMDRLEAAIDDLVGAQQREDKEAAA